MSRITTLILLMISMITANAQVVNIETSRKVATKGYAEKEVTPDIVYLAINIREFYQDGNSKKKVNIETLEKQLFDAAMAAGVKKEDFTLQNIYSYNQQDKKKNNEILQSRQYRLKVTNLNGLNTMMEKVDPRSLQSTSIEGYDYKNKREIEKELKTAAVKDARTNAEILAAADGQTLGLILVINDNSYFSYNDMMPQPRAMFSKVGAAAGVEAEAEPLNIEIRPIKLTCNIDCVFALK